MAFIRYQNRKKYQPGNYLLLESNEIYTRKIEVLSDGIIYKLYYWCRCFGDYWYPTRAITLEPEQDAELLTLTKEILSVFKTMPFLMLISPATRVYPT